jgi:hypothetical protein
MSPRYYHLAALLASIADELADDHDCTAEALERFDHSRARKLASAAGYIHRAAELVLDCEPSPELAAEVRALDAMCLCGHDRGEHLTEGPWACSHLGDDCACTGYLDAAPTIPVNVPPEWMAPEGEAS